MHTCHEFNLLTLFLQVFFFFLKMSFGSTFFLKILLVSFSLSHLYLGLGSFLVI